MNESSILLDSTPSFGAVNSGFSDIFVFDLLAFLSLFAITWRGGAGIVGIPRIGYQDPDEEESVSNGDTCSS